MQFALPRGAYGYAAGAYRSETQDFDGYISYLEEFTFLRFSIVVRIRHFRSSGTCAAGVPKS